MTTWDPHTVDELTRLGWFTALVILISCLGGAFYYASDRYRPWILAAVVLLIGAFVAVL